MAGWYDLLRKAIGWLASTRIETGPAITWRVRERAAVWAVAERSPEWNVANRPTQWTITRSDPNES